MKAQGQVSFKPILFSFELVSEIILMFLIFAFLLFIKNEQLIELTYHFMKKGFNQYAPMAGLPELRNLVADKTEKFYDAKYDPETEITITAGGTQAIFTALAAVINPGDEVIIFEPAYDCYSPTVKLLGGLVKPFELHAPDYKIDWEMVKKMFSANTKLIILNSPHNPTGGILTKTDMEALIKLTKNTDVLILSDEVYEHIIFDNEEHQSVAKYPELQERSFIVASFGKLSYANLVINSESSVPSKSDAYTEVIIFVSPKIPSSL